MKKKLFLITLILMIISNFSGFAQFTGWGNDQMFQAALPLLVITSYPPIYDDMPAKTKIAYQYMYNQNHKYDPDYLSKYYYDINDLDTLKKFGSYLFAIHLYNSMLMLGIINQTYWWKIPNDSMLTYPTEVFSGMRHALMVNYRSFGEQYFFLIYSDLIMKVKIDSVVYGIDTTFQYEENQTINASATILNNILGNKNPCNCKVNDFSNAENFSFDTSSNCINFTYPKYWSTNTEFLYGYDSLGLIKTVNKNEEYFLFLKLNIMTDTLNVIEPINNFETTGGLFQVIDGKVHDPDNFWGLGTEVDEDVFVNHLKKLKSDIESWFDPTLSVNKLINADKLSYFPNTLHPGESLNLSISLESAGEVSVSLYDALGRQSINTYRTYMDAGSHSIQYSEMGGLQPGIYFLRVTAEGKVWTGKVAVIK